MSSGCTSGRALAGLAGEGKQFVLGRGVDERALVEPVVAVALQESGSRIVAQASEMPLDLAVLPVIVVGARSDKAAEACELGLSRLVRLR